MASEKAIEEALKAFSNGGDWRQKLVISENMRAAIDAATAVDGDKQWNTACEAAAKVADGFTCGLCGMDGKAAAAIRSLKRLK